jgi:8-amino-7-oxononanoate synthase
VSQIQQDLGSIDPSLRRQLRLASGPGPRVHVDGREVVAFCSNDYLGLAGDTRLADALARGAQEEGAGAGAARLISGHRPSHAALEREIAAFKGSDAALLFGSGYLANISILPTLVRAGDLVVSDRLNHASLIDGCRLSRAEVVVVPHRDVRSVQSALSRGGSRRRVVVTEGLFSMEGHSAPLAEIAAVCRAHEALLLVDDAHGSGVLGPAGRGALEAAGLTPGEDLVEVGTFGKAFGGYGAFVAWTRQGIELLLHRARGFFFSTGLPPGVAAMNRAGVHIAREEPARRERLRGLVSLLREGLSRLGLEAGSDGSPIVPVILGDPEKAVAAAARLFEEGFWVTPIRPPTVPAGTSRLRLSLSAAHTEDDVRALLAALERALP